MFDGDTAASLFECHKACGMCSVRLGLLAALLDVIVCCECGSLWTSSAYTIRKVNRSQILIPMAFSLFQNCKF